MPRTFSFVGEGMLGPFALCVLEHAQLNLLAIRYKLTINYRSQWTSFAGQLRLPNRLQPERSVVFSLAFVEEVFGVVRHMDSSCIQCMACNR